MSLLLSGCATLPSNGPTGPTIEHSVKSPDNVMGFRILAIDQPLVTHLDSLPPDRDASALRALKGAAAIDHIGPGDSLNISIFEIGTALFAKGGSLVGDASTFAQVPGASVEPIGGFVVDGAGAITVPYAGRIDVAGHSPVEVQHLIEERLKGLSQKPQVVVSVRQNITNTVFVMGDVERPGRQSLTFGHETLLEAVALAGGAGRTPQDKMVRFTRQGGSVEVQLQDIRAGSIDDIALVPGDKIEIVHQPRSFTVFGAASKVAQVPFDTRTVSLAEALSRAGGASDAAADPRAVYIFRFEPTQTPVVGAPPGTRPVIYRLDLLNPASYFLMQRFTMRDKDVLYVANARANQPAKLVQIISQLFTPVILARQVTR